MARVPRDVQGEIARLHRLLTEHGEAIEADLQQFHGIALSDLTTGRLTWRRLGVLVEELPPGSALAARLNPSMRWSNTEHLLAALVDLAANGNWQRGGGKGRKPKPIPRPGKSTGRRIGRTNRSPREVATYLARFAPKKEEVTNVD